MRLTLRRNQGATNRSEMHPHSWTARALERHAMRTRSQSPADLPSSAVKAAGTATSAAPSIMGATRPDNFSVSRRQWAATDSNGQQWQQWAAMGGNDRQWAQWVAMGSKTFQNADCCSLDRRAVCASKHDAKSHYFAVSSCSTLCGGFGGGDRCCMWFVVDYKWLVVAGRWVCM